jgi:hypothetical protein
MLHITISHLNIRYEIPTSASEHEKSILKYAVEAYYYVLPIGTHSYSQFADAIAAVYSLDEPRNRYIVDLLRRLDALDGWNTPAQPPAELSGCSEDDQYIADQDEDYDGIYA